MSVSTAARWVVYVRVESAVGAEEELAALEVVGQVQRSPAWTEWTAPQFEVRSAEPVEMGIDGEARILEPPLRFVGWLRALTVRLPRTALRPSSAVRAVRLIAKPTVVALWHTVLGRPMGVG